MPFTGRIVASQLVFCTGQRPLQSTPPSTAAPASTDEGDGLSLGPPLSDLLSATKTQVEGPQSTHIQRTLGHTDSLNLLAVEPGAFLSISLMTHEMNK